MRLLVGAGGFEPPPFVLRIERCNGESKRGEAPLYLISPSPKSKGKGIKGMGSPDKTYERVQHIDISVFICYY